MTEESKLPSLVGKVFYSGVYRVASVPERYSNYESYFMVTKQKHQLIWGMEKYRKVSKKKKENSPECWTLAQFAGIWQDANKRTLALSGKNEFFQGYYDKKCLHLTYIGSDASSFKVDYKQCLSKEMNSEKFTSLPFQ